MNIGQWSGVFYSPVNIDFGLKEWVEKPVNETHFLTMLPFDNDF
jgi:hypothetical protein